MIEKAKGGMACPMRRVKYIGFYDIKNEVAKKRNAPPAALTKMQYIICAINRIGFGVDIISPTKTESAEADQGYLLRDGDNTLKLFATCPAKKPLGKIVSFFQRQIALFFYLLSHLSREDTVIVYHSLFLVPVLTVMKKIKGFRLIVEVEEIYADVIGKERSINKEQKLFCQADAFIFSTQLLNERINVSGKPYTVIHGTYQCEPDLRCSFDDGRIHIVYAGTLDPRKGGLVAAATAEFLDARYYVHILGFGSAEDKAALQKVVDEVSKKSTCSVRFEGLLQGEDYTRFLQCCQIGLCPQDPGAAFTATSFPSKILSYMANGLRVLSIRIPAIEQSAVGEYLYFFNEQTPQEIAKAIQKIDMSKEYNSRSLINQLADSFMVDMQALLENLEI